jgi:ribosome-binding ATPase YchF (GTP1/OBG family)
MKPMLYIANVSEDDIATGNEYVEMVKEFAKKDKAEVVVVSAKIEEELSDLDDETKEEFLKDYGLEQSGLDILVQKAYDLLGLKTFLTAGPDECRAWTFKNGMKAPECAGIIHSDFERGFIRAETYAFDDLVQYGTPLKVKEAGRVRLEGKEYIVQDGDIMLFRFNV